jgi:hypothetical protein
MTTKIGMFDLWKYVCIAFVAETALKWHVAIIGLIGLDVPSRTAGLLTNECNFSIEFIHYGFTWMDNFFTEYIDVWLLCLFIVT